MTVPFERTRALISAKEFLEAMLDPKATPRTPRWMRERVLGANLVAHSRDFTAWCEKLQLCAKVQRRSRLC